MVRLEPPLQKNKFYKSFREKECAIDSVPVQVANEMFRAGFKYLDVRSAEEYNDEHVEGSINIPYFEKWSVMCEDCNFLENVEGKFRKRDGIIVGCTRNDHMSFMAANKLVNAGFMNVTILGGGYEAWERSGLPIVTNGKKKACIQDEEIKNEDESKVVVRHREILYD